MSAPVAPITADHVTGAKACRIIGCTPTVLQRAALLGHVGVVLAPGMTPRYRLADVQKYAQERPKAVPRNQAQAVGA